jgi:outer membrane receptor protein involved in Fe transport
MAAASQTETIEPKQPAFSHAFSASIDVGQPVDLGIIDDGRERFVPILGGKVYGQRLNGIILAAGGDWQTVRTDGRTELLARYYIQALDGTVIAIENPGMRVASPEVIEQIARGEEVPTALYYSGGSPRFRVANGPHDWLRKRVLFARGVRRPLSLTINFYTID